MSIFSDIKKAFQRIGRLDDDLKRAFRDIRKQADIIDDIQRARKWAGRSINRIDDKLGDLPKTIEREAEKVAKEVAEDLEDALTEKLPELMQGYLAELERAVAREGLRKIRDAIEAADREIEELRERKPELADALDLPGGAIKLGPMTLKYSGFFTRTEKLADSLDHYVNDPPRFRRGPLLQLIEALGPDSVDLGIDIGAALLVVKSETLSVGFSVDELPMEVFTEVADAIMEACGVPE